MSDPQALFRAARAQRDFKTKKLTKEQLRQLKDDRSRVAQELAQQAKAATAAQTARRDVLPVPSRAQQPAPQARSQPGSMGPPPPKAPPARPVPSEAAPAEHASAASPSALPSNFFDDGAASPSNAPVEAAQIQAASSASVPQGFFEAYADQPEEPEAAAEPSSSNGHLSEHQQRVSLASPAAQPAQASALPKGFFENTEADAKARGEAPVKKKTQAEEYEDFMSSISADVKDMEAREQTEAADAAADRADPHHLVTPLGA
ncbi:hypothetical protein WJX73_010602 [Symbiochloris irregularis]|uniref:Uncharacterized protein n=1 Tax=Symbiochloris irregularis TaxID=706552 RepID=A0AAW1NV09_9CHLO